MTTQHKRYAGLSLLFSALILSGCNTGQATNSTEEDVLAQTGVIAQVNGMPITKGILEAYAEQRGPMVSEDELVNELIDRQLIYQNALDQGLQRDPQIAAELQNMRINILANAAVQQRLAKVDPSEEELRKEYQERVGELSFDEYKARHILTATEEEALAVVAELDKGADFTTLARQKSTGPSGEEGGDLGWFSPEQMVPEFGQAVMALEPGSYTKTPVQTQFGWHVILLEDTREVPPPPFEQVEDQLRNIVMNRHLETYIGELRQKAEIQVEGQ